MPTSNKRADTLAREHTEAAIQTLAEILYDEDAKPETRIKAADSLLDRGHGKPVQAVIAIPMDKQARDALYDMTDEQLMDEAKRRMRERTPVLEHQPQAEYETAAKPAEFEPIDPLLE